MEKNRKIWLFISGVYLLVTFLAITSIQDSYKIKKLENKIKQLEEVQNITKTEFNNDFKQFCNNNKLIYIIGEDKEKEIYITDIKCK